MQGPTHLVTGILIQKILRNLRPVPFRYFLVASLAVISHGLLDKLATLTYHPSNPLSGDWFWISYHLIIAFLTIFIFAKYWKKYKLGLIFSVLPDFDWVLIHSSNLFSLQIPFWKGPILHEFFFSFLDSLPFLRFLNTLPQWTIERKGVIFELILFLILIFSVYILRGKDHHERRKF